MTKLLNKFINDTEGQDLIEYALLAATIAIGCVVAMQAVRAALQTQFNAVSSGIAS